MGRCQLYQTLAVLLLRPSRKQTLSSFYVGVVRFLSLKITSACLVLYAVDLVVLCVESADEHVVADVVQVPSELEPWAGHRDVVGRALTLSLRNNPK